MLELDRREFLKIGVVAFLGIYSLELFPACNNQEPPTPYTVAVLQRLGRELSTWKFNDGTLMAGKFPEIKKCADLLSGSLDPTQYFPFIKIPVGFSLLAGSEMAALVMQRIPDLNDSRKIVVTTKEGQVLNAPMLARNTPADIAMSQDVLNSSIRLPVLVKEVFTTTLENSLRFFINNFLSQRSIPEVT